MPAHKRLLRLDSDVIETLKKDGPGWQSRLNAALRKQLGLPSVAAAGRKRA